MNPGESKPVVPSPIPSTVATWPSTPVQSPAPQNVGAIVTPSMTSTSLAARVTESKETTVASARPAQVDDATATATATMSFSLRAFTAPSVCGPALYTGITRVS